MARGDLPEEVETVLFSLDEGTNSECITTSDGYYFVKCITKIDEEKTQENREKILQEAYEEAFDTTYEEFLSTLSFEVNEELWESIELQDNESITTTSFFTTYNEQMAGN